MEYVMFLLAEQEFWIKGVGSCQQSRLRTKINDFVEGQKILRGSIEKSESGVIQISEFSPTDFGTVNGFEIENFCKERYVSDYKL